ncbi:hypothetical protein AtubIFM61612_008502 [Aspergillus tubingensis]|nr:hypothetical protein AtubIFM57143_002671 [Aspergillus tubingensis]GLB18605.1 hypothetical protein AtubIFM61612_008502 [Aspergillus tubingensis]
MEALLQTPEFSPVKWLEGVTVDDSAPKYLIPSQRRRGQLSDADFSTLEVKIEDLGGVKISELATNEPLFPLETFGITREEIDNDHCTLIEKRLSLNNQDADFADYLRERLPENFGAENAESLASFLTLANVYLQKNYFGLLL